MPDDCLKDKVEHLRQVSLSLDEVERTLSDIQLIENFFDDLPFPAWVRDIRRSQFLLNDEYNRRYNMTSKEINLNDSGWPQKTIDRLAEIDEIMEEEGVSVEEVFCYQAKGTGKYYRGLIKQFPLHRFGLLIGFAGYVDSEEEITEQEFLDAAL